MQNDTKIVPSRVQPLYTSRISNGIAATADQFPFYVYMMSQGVGQSSSCGGSVISPLWVLTAAHCTYNYLSVDMYFGSTDVYEMTDIITSTYWHEHEQYNPSNYNNDISVIQLPQPLAYTSSIQPISLLTSSEAENSFDGQAAIVMGFGYMSDSDPTESPDLLYTNVIVIANSLCTSYYGSSIISAGTMCAKGASSSTQSICSGDSGGPMVISDGSGGYTQIGINSFVSTSGCTVGMPSGYVRLGSYLDWVSKWTGIALP